MTQTPDRLIPSAIDSSATEAVFLNHPATAAYIHVPFCRRRCYYCDFPISVVGDKPPLAKQDPERGFGTIADYVEILCQEITTIPKDTTRSISERSLDTVFFGGGTPSLLTVEQLDTILQTLDRQFGINANAEISMEIDPGTFDLAHLQGYKASGVNRLSLGVQAFQPELLAACGRTHTPDDIYAAVELIHRVNVPNYSLDLISGLPHLTPERWHESLTAAIALQPTHLSIYDLTVEPGTAFYRWYQPGVAPLPTDEMTVEMYRLAQRLLTQAGYEHYEISNYARSGYQCRHNRVYWENRPYYGFGMGAASYINRQRFTRPRKRQEYYQWVQELRQRNGAIECPPVSPNDVLLDTLMLGLRLADGLKLDDLAQRFGEPVLEQILTCLQPYAKQGWVDLQTSDQQPEHEGTQQPLDWSELHHERRSNLRIRLSDPEGFLFSNVVLTRLFESFDA